MSTFMPDSIAPRSGLWALLLAGGTTIASLAFACAAPFAAVAGLAAVTLNRREALLTVAALWLGNQSVGFGLLSYPWTANTIAWGFAIGAGALAGAFVAQIADRRLLIVALPARMLQAFLVAFAVYELVLWLASLVLGGGGFSLAVVGYIAGVNALWAAGLAAAYALISLQRTQTLLPFLRPKPQTAG